MGRSCIFIACTRKVDRLQITINAKDSNLLHPVLLHAGDGQHTRPFAWDNAPHENNTPR
jgi:hypothetical protein